MAVMTQTATIPAKGPEPGKPAVGTRGIRIAAIGNGRNSTWNEADSTFEFTLATETPCRAWRYNPRVDRVYMVDEVLLMSGIRNVQGLIGNPILDSHKSWELKNVLGVIEDARVEGDVLVCRGRLDTRDEIAGIRGMVANGILRNMSVGFDINSDDPMVTRDGEIPLVEVTDWTPVEGSIVPIPADSNATIRSGDNPMTAIRTAHVPGQRAAGADMTDEEKKAAELAAADAAAKKAEEENARSGVLAGFRSALAGLESFLGGGKRDKTEPAPPAAAQPTQAEVDARAERERVVAGYRSIAVKNGRAAEFDALALDATAPVESFREIAMLSMRSSAVEIAPFSSTGTEPVGGSGERLLSFHEIRAERAKRAAGRK